MGQILMTINIVLNEYYKITNHRCDYLTGMIGKCGGYYASDMSFPILRLVKPLPNNQRSVVVSSDILRHIKKYQPPTVDFVKKPDKWC